MDLIDKKLSEKLKLFEYIDKKYGADIDSSEKAPPKKSELNQNRNFIQNTFLPKETRSKKEIYDNIYSDFKTNSFKDYFQSPSINTLDSKKTKYQSKFQKIKRKNLRNNKEDKDSLEINRTAENTIRTKSNTKNLKALYPPNDSGNRLYNYGYYIKNKLNKKRQKEEEKMRKQMTPKNEKKNEGLELNKAINDYYANLLADQEQVILNTEKNKIKKNKITKSLSKTTKKKEI